MCELLTFQHLPVGTPAGRRPCCTHGNTITNILVAKSIKSKLNLIQNAILIDRGYRLLIRSIELLVFYVSLVLFNTSSNIDDFHPIHSQ